jgi:hypothetical membrane protein
VNAGRASPTPLDRLAIAAGLIGATVIATGSVVTALAYTGSKGEAYSPLNHFVSELGELAVSRFAAVFNTALIVGGVSFVVFMLGLAAAGRGRARYLYGAVGAIAGVGGALVGVFPMDYLRVHSLAALTFFLLGLVTVLLASIDFLRRPDPRFPGWLALLGGVTVAAFAVFLVILFGGSGDLARPDDRPEVWLLTVFEWLLIVGINLWVFLTAWSWWRATR